MRVSLDSLRRSGNPSRNDSKADQQKDLDGDQCEEDEPRGCLKDPQRSLTTRGDPKSESHRTQFERVTVPEPGCSINPFSAKKDRRLILRNHHKPAFQVSGKHEVAIPNPRAIQDEIDLTSPNQEREAVFLEDPSTARFTGRQLDHQILLLGT